MKSPANAATHRTPSPARAAVYAVMLATSGVLLAAFTCLASVDLYKLAAFHQRAHVGGTNVAQAVRYDLLVHLMWVGLSAVQALCFGHSLRCELAEIRRARREMDGRCGMCDYDLTGNLSGRCPECGAENSQREAPSANDSPGDNATGA